MFLKSGFIRRMAGLFLMGLCFLTSGDSNAGSSVSSDCAIKGIKLYGKVQIVENFADLKVQVVSNFEDLKVQKVDHFPDSCGKWQIVEHFPDFKVQLVENFPDLKIKFVEHFPGL